METNRKGEAVVEEGDDVSDIGHRLVVAAGADHREPAGGDLAEEVVDVAAVVLTEDDCRADDDERPPARCLGVPATQFPLGAPLRPAILVERRDRPILAGVRRRHAVHRHATGKQDRVDVPRRRRPADIRRPGHVDIVIERQRPNVVAVLGGKMDDRSAGDKSVSQGAGVADIADHRVFRKSAAGDLVDDREPRPPLADEPLAQPRADEAAAADHVDMTVAGRGRRNGLRRGRHRRQAPLSIPSPDDAVDVIGVADDDPQHLV